MPKKKSKVSAGTARRLVAKTVEDKTFGMKNKKGAKARKFIQHVEQQAKAKFMNQGRHRGMVNEQQQQAEKKKRKEAIKKEAVLMAQMLGISVEDATAAFTGKKVKKKKSKTKDKSEEVEIGPDGKKKKKKAGVSESSAIQKAQARRRALRRQRKRAAGEEYEIDESLYEEDTPIEEIIEEERKALIESGVKLTPITFENFQEWKKRKKLKKDTEAIANKNISGRLLFEQHADKYNVDDAAAADNNEYEVTEEGQDGGVDDDEDFNDIPDIDSIPDTHSSDEEDELEELPEEITNPQGGAKGSPVANPTKADLFMNAELDDLDLDDLDD